MRVLSLSLPRSLKINEKSFYKTQLLKFHLKPVRCHFTPTRMAGIQVRHGTAGGVDGAATLEMPVSSLHNYAVTPGPRSSSPWRIAQQKRSHEYLECYSQLPKGGPSTSWWRIRKSGPPARRSVARLGKGRSSAPCEWTTLALGESSQPETTSSLSYETSRH